MAKKPQPLTLESIQELRALVESSRGHVPVAALSHDMAIALLDIAAESLARISPRTGEETGWQTMETAPRDEEFMAWIPGEAGGPWRMWAADDDFHLATYWMPMPSPPAPKP